MLDRITPDIIRAAQQGQTLNPVEAAFRAVACLDDAQRAAFEARFNGVFGRCTPPMNLHFTSTQGDLT